MKHETEPPARPPVTSEQMAWRAMALAPMRKRVEAIIDANNRLAALFEGRAETDSVIKDMALFTMTKNRVEGFSD